MPTETKAPPQKGSVRDWQVPVSFVDEFGVHRPDPMAAQLALEELRSILFRIGGTASIAAVRADFPQQNEMPARTETVQLVIRHHTYAPKAPPAPAESPNGEVAPE